MTQARYDKITSYFTAHPGLLKLLRYSNSALTGLVYIAYPALIVLLALRHDPRLVRVLVIPATVFGSVTLLRLVINAPRPYEKLSITPLITREGAGHSFPSRHAASAAVIAATFLTVWPPAGVLMTLVALSISALRLLAGIHFLRDVIVGFLFGFVVGLVGLLL